MNGRSRYRVGARLLFRGQRVEEPLLRPSSDGPELTHDRPAGGGEGDRVATPVGWIAGPGDEAAVLEVVDGGHQVARVQVEGVGQLLLGQGAEVIEGAEDGVVEKREAGLSQARLQVPAAVPGHWCDDVDAETERLSAAGAAVEVEPYDHVAGHGRAYPDGNWLALVDAH